MKKILFLMLSIFCILFAGCADRPRPPEPPECRVVTEITIQVENVPQPGLCRYSNPRKMTKALNYLRRLDPWDLPDTDPETVPGARYHITLYFSDGSTKVYDQIAYDYLRESDGPWREIDPEYALRLPLLLAAVPSD